MGTNDKIFINPYARSCVKMEHFLGNIINSKKNSETYSLISSVANMLEAKQFKYKNSDVLGRDKKIVKINYVFCLLLGQNGFFVKNRVNTGFKFPWFSSFR